MAEVRQSCLSFLDVSALECDVWRTYFRRGYGPVARQTTGE